MAFKDLKARLLGWLNGRDPAGSSNRPDGGTSCYRPVQRRNRQEEELARKKAAEYAGGQQAVNLHTGFTGMNPPMSGPVPVQSTHPGPSLSGYGTRMQGQPETGWAPAAEMPSGNISYMPGVYSPDAGSTFTHVEHILTITSLRSCYEAIECMKNEETLIVTLDVLGNDSERIRCQDMLAGAAFTLGCSVRNLQSVGVVVIAPAGVKILPERQAGAWAEPQQMPQAAQAAPAQPAGYTPRRERRSSQNPVGWDRAAGSAGPGYNPYTGSMPAAAGGYSAYGGY